MSSIIADYTSGANMLEGLHTFLCKGHTLKPSFTGTGNGYCDDAIGTTTSVQEVITATFTSATAFDVVGSVSGAMGSGTVGSLFSHARFTCTVVAGTVAWVSGDTVTWTMTPPWDIITYTSGQSYIYTAPGNDGAQDINVGWTVKSNSTGGYYGIRIGAYPTILPGGGFWRPHTVCWMPLGSYAGSSLRMVATASGQACWICAIIGTYYIHGLVGYADAVGTLASQPAPYIVGGARGWTYNGEPSDTSVDWMHTNSYGGPLALCEAGNIYNNEQSNSYAVMYVRNSTNRWSPVATGLTTNGTNNVTNTAVYKTVTPISKSQLITNLDGSIPTWPIIIDRFVPTTVKIDFTTIGYYPDIIGSVPFVRQCPSYDSAGNLLLAQSTFRAMDSRTKLMILQTKNDSSENSLFALEIY